MLIEQISTTFLLHGTLDFQASEMFQVLKCTIYVYLQKFQTQYISGKKAGEQSVNACNWPLFLNYMNDQTAVKAILPLAAREFSFLLFFFYNSEQFFHYIRIKGGKITSIIYYFYILNRYLTKLLIYKYICMCVKLTNLNIIIIIVCIHTHI